MNLKRKRKRSAILALSVSTMFIVGATAVQTPSAWASTGTPPPIVSGKVQISTPSELWYVDQNQTAPIASGSSTDYLDASIELTPNTTFDLSSSGELWTPLGDNANPFTGTFDGSDDVISGESLVSSSGDDSGLFGFVEKASIENVKLQDEKISVTGSIDVGSLVGSLDSGTIKDVSATGVDISGVGISSGAYGGVVGSDNASDISGTDVAGSVGVLHGADGGLIGNARGSIVSGSYTDVVVSGGSKNGGLIADDYSGSVYGSATSGQVTGQSAGSGRTYNGGLVGYSDGVTIHNSVALGAVSGKVVPSGSGVVDGGLIGGADISHVSGSYAAGNVKGENLDTSQSSSVMNGGLIGYLSSSTVDNAFALGDVSGGHTTTDAGLAGYLYNKSHIYDAYSAGAVTAGSGSVVGGVAGVVSGATSSSRLYEVGFAGPSSLQAIGSGSAFLVESGSVVDAPLTSMEEPIGYGSLSWLPPTVWSEASGVNHGLPYITLDSAPGGTGTSGGAATAPSIVSGNVEILTTSGLLYVDRHQTEMISAGSETNYLHASIQLEPNKTFDLTGDNWIPLGTLANPFKGKFDGSNDSISGETVVPGANTGFFGAAKDASIENVKLQGESLGLPVSATSGNIGGLAGLLNSSTVKNVAITVPHATFAAPRGMKMGVLRRSLLVRSLATVDPSVGSRIRVTV